MKMLRLDRRVRFAAMSVELLESRRLLSATLLSNIPAQSFTPGSAATQIDLATYLGDPSLTGGTVIQMQTPLGNIPLELTNSQTPNTVTNFLKYITNGEYSPTIIQRSQPGFVLQGGGTKPNGSNNTPLAPVATEAGINNTTGTIAMALSSGPNSGTNQWFINLANNGSYLNGTAYGGPFTAFGNVIDGGMTVVNAIAALPYINGGAENSNWDVADGLPVINYNGSSAPTTVPEANLVTDNIVTLTGAAAEPTYTVIADSQIVTATVANGILTLAPAAGVTSGSTTVTATITDLSGQTASSTFSVSVSPPPTLSIAAASATANSSAQVVFPVTLSSASSSEVTLNYALTAGTAAAADFAATGTSLTIPAGSTTADIPVGIIQDSSAASETFTITLSGLSSNAAFPDGETSATATGTILPAAVTIVPPSTTVATTTTLTTSASAIPEGGTDTFVATVTSADSGSTPTGTVNFTVDGTVLGTETLVGGTASLTNILTAPGNQSVTATYSGDSADTASTSNAISVNVSTFAPTVAKITLPTTAVITAPIRGSLLLSATNSTVATEKGTSIFDLYASTDGAIDGTSVLIATVRHAVNLKAGKSIKVAIPLKAFPATLSAGTYTLLLQTTDPSGNISDAASGPSVTLAAPFIALTESITKLMMPASVVAGSKTSAAAVVRITNAGNITSTGATAITLLASTGGTLTAGTSFKTITRKLSIPAGKSVAVAVPLGAYPAVADGDYFIVAEVTDPHGTGTSTQFADPVNIALAKIDLANSITYVPATGKIGRTIEVALDVTNYGNIAAAGTLQIAFSASTSSTGTDGTSLAALSTKINIKPGRSQVLHVKVPLPAGLSTGQFYLVSVLDPANLFNDVDLTNNTSVSASPIAIS